ncbi:hypothetical protein BDD12DRAFT_823320 [Trichophaea hybrida]|nr:hypothetical protein BDD12DRAFT_823320 [Trichophaea hybrida]
MPLPVPSPTPATPNTNSSSAPTRQPRPSGLPTPSKRPPSAASSVAPTSDPPSSSPTSRLPSSPSRLTRPRPSTTASRQSCDNDPSSDPSESDSSRMPPPAAPSRQPKERAAVRRTAGTRNLKDKDDPKKPERAMSLRSATRSSSISTTATAKSKEDGARDKGPPPTGRSLRPRNVSNATAASTATTERPRVASTASRTAAVTKKESASMARERSTATTATTASTVTTSRRPLSMHADLTSLSPPTSSASTAPRKVAAPSAGNVKAHRRNLSTPSAAQVAPLQRPGTAASTVSNVSKSRRPPFSTLRQDFNAPPAPTLQPSRKSMPPPPLDSATVHQQAQLLQYTCLYSNSHATYAQLTASATAKLKRRFDTLAREHSRSREQLARRQRLHDMTSLTAVVESPAVGITGKRRETMRSPEEKIQAFSEAIKKLETLQQNEHRTLAGVFGEWIAGYSPPSPGIGMDRSGWVDKRGRWIDGLGEDWRRQCLFISRRIEAAVKSIETVVSAVLMEEEAGVVSVVSERWMDIASGMLEESQGMLQVEQNVVHRERQALEDVVAGAGVGVEEEEGEAERKGVWVKQRS